jgi:membrane protease YdiL (CAAX protease family)
LGNPNFGWRFWLGLVIALGAMVAMALQARRVLGDNSKLRRARRMLEPVMFLLPHTPEELRHFRGLSVTAGICEEILFRGYLIWYLYWLVGFWQALLISSLVFGLAHSYQGPGGILRTTAVGLLFALFYVLTFSIWVPMLLHAFIDINSGQAAYAIANTPEEEPTPAPAA